MRSVTGSGALAGLETSEPNGSCFQRCDVGTQTVYAGPDKQAERKTNGKEVVSSAQVVP